MRPLPIADEDLRLDDIPGDGAGLDEIMRFAATMDGFRVAGSFERCAKIAHAPDPESITELRIELFFFFRAMRHTGDYEVDEDGMGVLRGKVERIRRLVAESERKATPVGKVRTKERRMAAEKVTKTFSFGGGDFGKLSPKREDLGAGTKMLNITLSFEDALKLNLAIDECVRKLNSYKRSTKEGKRSALQLVVHLEQGRITVGEGKL